MQAGRLPVWRSAINHPQPFARVLCIIVAAALIGFELWSAVSAQIEQPSPVQARDVAAAGNGANVEQIISAELFGRSNAGLNANLPQTTLQVTLRAVFAASDPKFASAVIESSDGRTQMIKVGGTVDASTTLQAVHPNRIVLSRNGELETLLFPAPQESSEVPADTLADTQNRAMPETTTVAGVNLPPGMTAEEIKRSAILQRLEELRARTQR